MRVETALRTGNLPGGEREILLAGILGKDRAWLLAHPEAALTPAQASMWTEWCRRRRCGEPIAYMTGEREFYGRLFHVTPDVLIPRPSTEGLIDAVMAFLREPRDETWNVDAGIVAWARVLRKREPVAIVDLCTGSGCIAVTIALLLPDVPIIATDVSWRAVCIARQNADRHGVSDRIQFREGRGFQPIQRLREPFLLVSNPPYISERADIPSEVRDFEPHEALFAGERGTTVLTEIVKSALAHGQCMGMVIECMEEQTEELGLGLGVGVGIGKVPHPNPNPNPIPPLRPMVPF